MTSEWVALEAGQPVREGVRAYQVTSGDGGVGKVTSGDAGAKHLINIHSSVGGTRWPHFL